MLASAHVIQCDCQCTISWSNSTFYKIHIRTLGILYLCLFHVHGSMRASLLNKHVDMFKLMRHCIVSDLQQMYMGLDRANYCWITRASCGRGTWCSTATWRCRCPSPAPARPPSCPRTASTPTSGSSRWAVIGAELVTWPSSPPIGPGLRGAAADWGAGPGDGEDDEHPEVRGEGHGGQRGQDQEVGERDTRQQTSSFVL